MSRRRILLVAYQCGAGMGSVSQIGWEWYSRLATDCDVTLVTHVRNRDALERSGAPHSGSSVIYVDTEWFAGPLYRLAKRIFRRSEHSVFLLSSLDYFVFDWTAFRRLRSMLRSGARWDIVHRVTPVTLAAPTWLGRLGLPMVIGPLNSGLKDPAGFGKIMRQESTWLVRLRGISRVLDVLIGSSRRAARILTASKATLAGVPESHRARCTPMIENGVDLQRYSPTDWPDAPRSGAPLRVLFVGRLIPVKALHILIDAVASLHSQGVDVALTVVGDGPMRAEWERLSFERGIAHVTEFAGSLPSSEVARHMQRCHVFCLPSVRESGGAVLLEAMASARPVIAMNYGGPAELVDETVGRLIDMTNPEQASRHIAACLADVIGNPLAWQRRGLAGRRRVETQHSWPAKLVAANRIYTEILTQGIRQWV
jgi:glycosyltransferase involved in cell wall biosynthesis